MDRFTISLNEDLARQFDELIHKKGYQNRSEAVRDKLRNELESARLEREESPYCVASLSYVYNHHARDLTERLTNLQHEHHQLVLSAMHVHLDHDNCLETVILRGATAEVSKFAGRHGGAGEGTQGARREKAPRAEVRGPSKIELSLSSAPEYSYLAPTKQLSSKVKRGLECSNHEK